MVKKQMYFNLITFREMYYYYLKTTENKSINVKTVICLITLHQTNTSATPDVENKLKFRRLKLLGAYKTWYTF